MFKRSSYFKAYQKKATDMDSPPPPPEGWFKVNVDAAIKMSDQQAGLGIVIKSSRGNTIAAAVERIPFQGNVACMEAEAALFGLQKFIQVNCVPIIIESDSSEVVDLSLSRKDSMTEIGWTIAEIQKLLKSQNLSRIQHAPRECNVVADSLAKLALKFESPALCLEKFPDDVLMLLSDLS